MTGSSLAEITSPHDLHESIAGFGFVAMASSKRSILCSALLETDMEPNQISRDSVLGLFLRRVIVSFDELAFVQARHTVSKCLTHIPQVTQLLERVVEFVNGGFATPAPQPDSILSAEALDRGLTETGIAGLAALAAHPNAGEGSDPLRR